MGLGPAVCDDCYIILQYKESRRELCCPRCNKWNSSKNLWTLRSPIDMVVEFRSDFYNAIPQRVKDFPVTTEYPHILHRRFIVNNREPNEVYRHWLETNVGMQGIDWAWDISIADLSMVDIKFVDSEHAVLFELTWP